jgi:predicted Fe-Mo cluster-binding NifX family protein
MKIAISALEPGLEGEVDPRFGRSQYFILVEPETMHFESFRNPNLESTSGAGIGTAQVLCEKGAGTVITGKIGPKAHQVLSAAGVRMITGVSGRVSNAIERFKAGKLPGETASRTDSAMGAGGGMGSGMRAGGGRGTGMGPGMARGMGRGMGCGGGKGRGMGPGRGGGGSPLPNWEAEPWSDRETMPNRQDELALLKQEANMLANELTRNQQRIEQMESKSSETA